MRDLDTLSREAFSEMEKLEIPLFESTTVKEIDGKSYADAEDGILNIRISRYLLENKTNNPEDFQEIVVKSYIMLFMIYGGYGTVHRTEPRYYSALIEKEYKYPVKNIESNAGFTSGNKYVTEVDIVKLTIEAMKEMQEANIQGLRVEEISISEIEEFVAIDQNKRKLNNFRLVLPKMILETGNERFIKETIILGIVYFFRERYDYKSALKKLDFKYGYELLGIAKDNKFDEHYILS